MRNFNGPRPLYRWQLGLLLLNLPRRLISCGLSDFPARRANEPVPYPVGQARSRQLGSLPDQRFMVWDQSNVQRGRVPPFGRFRFHGSMVHPTDTRSKREKML